MQSRSLSFVSAHQARNSSVKALWRESTGVIALIGRSHRRLRLRETSQFRGQKIHGNDTEWQEDCVSRHSRRRRAAILRPPDTGRQIRGGRGGRPDDHGVAECVDRSPECGCQLGRPIGSKPRWSNAPAGQTRWCRAASPTICPRSAAGWWQRWPQTSHSRTRPREC
jgi:hypothetical protein